MDRRIYLYIFLLQEIKFYKKLNEIIYVTEFKEYSERNKVFNILGYI